jgi:hypothetical protein
MPRLQCMELHLHLFALKAWCLKWGKINLFSLSWIKICYQIWEHSVNLCSSHNITRAITTRKIKWTWQIAPMMKYWEHFFVYTDVQLITMATLRCILPSIAQTLAESVGLNPTWGVKYTHDPSVFMWSYLAVGWLPVEGTPLISKSLIFSEVISELNRSMA